MLQAMSKLNLLEYLTTMVIRLILILLYAVGIGDALGHLIVLSLYTLKEAGLV